MVGVQKQNWNCYQPFNTYSGDTSRMYAYTRARVGDTSCAYMLQKCLVVRSLAMNCIGKLLVRHEGRKGSDCLHLQKDVVCFCSHVVCAFNIQMALR
mmetsp:Transcript_90321/g.157865  ORF Transcript_90321/g.157865 Transcript_90321/m.157865 type:complete len:97 (+) Transcript_90321:394-684(+)